MPLMEHLVELRTRLLYSIVAFIAAFGVAYYFHQPIFNFLVTPLNHVFEGQAGRRMIFTAPTEAFFTYIKVAFFTACALSFPVIANQVWLFVAPGLYRKEKNAFLPFIVATPVMFALGSGLLYYFVLPVALKFFTSFELPAAEGQLPIQLEAKMSEYLSLVMALIFAFGVSFELPVLLLLLVRVGLISAQTLAEKRRYAVVGVVAFAGVVTPPDVFSQLSLAIPMYLLYEASVWIGRWIEKGKAAREAAENGETPSSPAPSAPPSAAPAAAAATAAVVETSAATPATPGETDFNQSR
ncbi:MAG: twin-arginine translocase subunit TatC [Alphaproteobacteria bacterium]|nr:twin-arginine translocase subunit TatC [Alphaproteobacteria bacterium]